jgi:hypothetical protein
VTVRFSLDSSSPWRAPFAAGLRAWNDLVGSELDLILDSVAGGNVHPFPDEANRINNAYFSTDPNPNNSLAVTWWDFNICAPFAPCCQASPCAAASLVETDILFFVYDSAGMAINWSSAIPANISNSNVIGSSNYFAVVVSHELGHLAGLLDINNPQARMQGINGGYPNGGWLHSAVSDTRSDYERLFPKALDQTNIRSLYPAAGSGSRVYAGNIQPGNAGTPSQVLSYNPSTQNQTFTHRQQ